MQLMRKSAIWFAFAVLSFSPVVWANEFDEGVKHFYVQCYICHWSNNPEKANRPDNSVKDNGVKKATFQPGFSPDLFLRVQNVYGPDLRGVYSAPAGRRANEGYRHSEAFSKAAPNIVWTDETLDKWIADAQTVVPGSWMAIKLPDPEVRRAIIYFLKHYKE